MLTRPPPPPWRSQAPFALVDVEVRPASNELVVAGTPVRVKPRMMDVLLRLAAANGETVGRQTLLDDVWPRRIVNDEVLSRVIADLRVALRDDARDAKFIETIPKVGYRLVAPVVRMAAAGPGDAGAAQPALPPPDLRTSESARHSAPGAAARSPRRTSRWAVAGAGVAAIAFTAMLVLRPTAPAPALQSDIERQLARAEAFSSEVALELAPRFSPDGTRVAFAAYADGRAQVVVRTVADTQRITLGDPADANLSPVFFPDGARVAYLRRSAGGDCAIVAETIGSGDRATVVDCARRPRPLFDIAPDGRSLVYVGTVRPQFPAGLVLRDLVTGDERVLTAPEPQMGDDLYPRFSPDGARIVFFRGTQSHRDAWLLDVADPARARTTGSPRGLVYGAAWLWPAGPLLVAADWFGQRSLNLLDPARGTATTVGARGARFPDVSRNGDIVFENAVYAANLFLVDPAAPDAKPRPQWPATRYTNQPEYSPDGSRVVFTSNRDGSQALFVGTVDGAAARLALSSDYIYMRPHWSHDGRAVYAIRASRREDGTRVQQAIRIAVDTGAVDVLSALGDDVFDVREADAGRALIVGETAGNAARVLRRAAPDAPTERLPLPLVGNYQVAGNRIAFTQPELTGLTLCDLGTLKCEPVAVPVGDANRFDWLLTDDAVWYRAAATPDELVRFDLARREIGWRSAFAPTAFGLAFAVRPDGRALLVAREEPPAIDLMLAPRAH